MLFPVLHLYINYPTNNSFNPPFVNRLTNSYRANKYAVLLLRISLLFISYMLQLNFHLSSSSEDELFVFRKHSTEIECVCVGECVVVPLRSKIREKMLRFCLLTFFIVSMSCDAWICFRSYHTSRDIPHILNVCLLRSCDNRNEWSDIANYTV